MIFILYRRGVWTKVGLHPEIPKQCLVLVLIYVPIILVVMIMIVAILYFLCSFLRTDTTWTRSGATISLWVQIDNESILVLICRLYQSLKMILVDYFFHMFECLLFWNFQGAGRKVILEVNYFISSFMPAFYYVLWMHESLPFVCLNCKVATYNCMYQSHQIMTWLRSWSAGSVDGIIYLHDYALLWFGSIELNYNVRSPLLTSQFL